MFQQRIQDGLDGKFKGLSNGLDRVNKYIFNVQRGCYTLLGGLSGAAKTTFIDFVLINALEDAERTNTPINVFYYSYEIDEISKRANWLSVLIYKKYGKIVAPEAIKGLGDYRLTTREIELVNLMMPKLNALFDKIMWRWESMAPYGMYKEWWSFMEGRGKFEYETYKEDEQVKKRITKFTNNNPLEYNLIVCDHLANARLQQGFNLKQNIDKLSEYAVTARNIFNMSIFFLQQFNQSLNSVERMKFKGVDISPQQSDFKDSSNPYTDADVVLGLLNAYKMDMDKCLGYNINIFGASYNLKGDFRMLKIVKNRLSRDNIAIGLFFMPQAGSFTELPPPEMMTSEILENLRKSIT